MRGLRRRLDRAGSRRGEINDDSDEPQAVEPPIDGVLDLHTFAPADVAGLVADYLDECAVRGMLEVRLIHGKGKGVLRQSVHAVLSRHERVASYRAAGEAEGGWGATIVKLRSMRDQAGGARA